MESRRGVLWRRVARLLPLRGRRSDVPDRAHYIPAFDDRVAKGWGEYSPATSHRRRWFSRWRH